VKGTQDERITYPRVTPQFIAVSGFRGSQIFYRKSNLAFRLIFPELNKSSLQPRIASEVAAGLYRYCSRLKVLLLLSFEGSCFAIDPTNADTVTSGNRYEGPETFAIAFD
jgi:hypothetical protein